MDAQLGGTFGVSERKTHITEKCTGVAGRDEIEINVTGGNPVILDGSSEPLVTSPYQPPEPSEPPSNDAHVVVRTSMLEAWIVFSLFALAYSLYMPDMRHSPRIAEWFGSLPIPIAYILFFTLTSSALGAGLTLFGLIVFGLLPSRYFSLSWLKRGSPPFVGALMHLLIAVAILGAFAYLALFED